MRDVGAWLRRTADVLAKVEGGIEIQIEIGIGIEIDNLHNDPILGKYGNLQPSTRNPQPSTPPTVWRAFGIPQKISVDQWLNPPPSISIPIPIAISNVRFRATRSEFLVHEDSSAGFSRRGSGAWVPRTADESALEKPRERGTPNEACGPQKISCLFVLFVVPKSSVPISVDQWLNPSPVDFDSDPDSDFEPEVPGDPFGVPRSRGFIRRLQPTRLRCLGSADGR